jgi:hypothetical protein
VTSTIVDKITPVCSVTMNAPLSNVWKSRVQRHEWSRTKVYREAAARRKAAEEAVIEQNHRDRVRELARLQRIFGRGDMMDAAAAAFARRRAGGR